MIAYECKKAELKAPVWDIGEYTVKLTFFSKTKLGGAVDGAKEKFDAVNDAVNEAVNEAVKRGVVDPLSDAVNDAIIDAIKIIATNEKGVSTTQIMEGIGKSNAQIKRYLQTLKMLDLIEFQGAAKIGKYYLTENMKSKLKPKQ